MEQLLLATAIFLSIIIMYASVKGVISHPVIRDRVIPLANLVALFFIYINMIVGFGLIYLAMLKLGRPILIENGAALIEPFHDLLQSVFYFSAVTLFSVGYGDITPIGYGRWVAAFEALIGYILPAIFVLSSFQGRKRGND